MSMGRQAGRMLTLVFVLVLGVFYGISVSREGIGQVYGPLEFEEAAAAEEERIGTAERDDGFPPWEEAAGSGAGEAVAAEPAPPDEPALHGGRTGETAMNRIAGKAGDLLRLLADGLIRLMVGLGEAVLS